MLLARQIDSLKNASRFKEAFAASVPT